MEITVLSTMDAQDIADEADYLEYICAYFETAQPVTKDSIEDVAKVDTVVLSHVYTFLSNGDRYLIFDDDNSLTPESVKGCLDTITTIQSPKGYLCKAKDTLDSDYGVSPEHDPFHDGYTYLWYCGHEKAVQVAK